MPNGPSRADSSIGHYLKGAPTQINLSENLRGKDKTPKPTISEAKMGQLRSISVLEGNMQSKSRYASNRLLPI